MPALIWSPDAVADLREIFAYVAEDNLPAAAKLIQHVQSSAERLARFPHLGRPGRQRGTRHLNIAGTPYFVVYRLSRSDVHISRVIHGARDWPPKRKRP